MSLEENIDYYINEDGNFVFTEAYHLKRGFCCKNGCLHCPWRLLPSTEGETDSPD
jgi:hypothetical protein